FFVFVFFFNDTATTEIYTLSLHDALPIFLAMVFHRRAGLSDRSVSLPSRIRSEEHTSELQSLRHLVCRLLLEKKNQNAGHDYLKRDPSPAVAHLRQQPPVLHDRRRVDVRHQVCFFKNRGDPDDVPLFPHGGLSL